MLGTVEKKRIKFLTKIGKYDWLKEVRSAQDQTPKKPEGSAKIAGIEKFSIRQSP